MHGRGFEQFQKKNQTPDMLCWNYFVEDCCKQTCAFLINVVVDQFAEIDDAILV
jgi:hypothetical protein